MKKIELHCHFDGSLNLEYASQLLGYDVRDQMSASDSTSLAEYLQKFNLPLQLLQTQENLTEFAHLLALDLMADNVIYAEIRFCPLLHCEQGLSLRQVVEAVLAGLDQVPKLPTNLILCMMRQFSNEQNIKIMKLAAELMSEGKRVCAVDLAGDEAAHPNSEFFPLLLMAQAMYGLPLTLHAGEASGPDSVFYAIESCAKRIGHGVRSIESPQLVQILAKKHIPLEVCPTSNIDTGLYSSIADHPIRRLLDAGIPITINTDNRTVSSTTLEQEYTLLRQHHHFTDEDFLHCNINAALHSFAPNELKVKLCRILMDDYAATHSKQPTLFP